MCAENTGRFNLGIPFRGNRHNGNPLRPRFGTGREKPHQLPVAVSDTRDKGTTFVAILVIVPVWSLHGRLFPENEGRDAIYKG